MTTCNATLTTQTETEEVLAKANRVDGTFYFNGVLLPRGDSVKRVGDKLMRVEIHTLTCDLTHAFDVVPMDSHAYGGDAEDYTEWCDGTPGAKPHEPVTNDDEWVRALRAVNAPEDIIERAARRVRSAQCDR